MSRADSGPIHWILSAVSVGGPVHSFTFSLKLNVIVCDEFLLCYLFALVFLVRWHFGLHRIINPSCP